MSADDVVAAIDGALRDLETSPDAMRWNPVLERDAAGAVRWQARASSERQEPVKSCGVLGRTER